MRVRALSSWGASLVERTLSPPLPASEGGSAVPSPAEPASLMHQCVNSFIALSSPSIVIGYMRLAKMRRMIVVDSE